MARDDTAEPKPVVGIICCTRQEGDHALHAVVEKYILAVAEGARALPFLVPALGDRFAAAEAATRLDGVLATGARSNIEPRHYGGAPSLPETPHDPARDDTVLPLLRAAVAADLPVLAICRGIQELNVALGGTLHQELHEVPGRLDHRSPPGTVEERYGNRAHPVRLTPGGYFAGLVGASTIAVNSLHHQGIDRLAPGLAVEATAPDGQIEAVRLPEKRFVVGVQWHPEYRLAENAVSRALFAAFGAACRAHAAKRRGESG